MKKRSTFFAAAVLAVAVLFSYQSFSQWSLTGNAGTVVSTNFLGTTDNKGLVFRTNNTERMRFTAAGLLGLGITAPVSKFQVLGNVTTSLSNPGYIVSGDVASYNLSLDNNEVQARLDSAAATLYLNYWGGNVWLGKQSASSVPLVYIDNATNSVGLGGYDNSAWAVNVTSTSSQGGVLADNVFTSSNPAFKGVKTGLGNAAWFEKSDPSSISTCLFATTNGTGQALYASATGAGSNGILCQAGSGGNGIEAYGGSGGYGGYFHGNVFTTGLYQSSDKKLKNNIKDMMNAMDIINKLKPKTYEFRNDGNYALMNLPKGMQYGLIAQDVEAVLPQLVKDSKFNTHTAFQAEYEKAEREGKPLPKSEVIEFKALDYVDLIPIMVKGMQEQEQTISDLKNEVNELKKLVQQLTQNNSNAIQSTVSGSTASLSQNTPNPFSADTKINCLIPSSAKNAILVISTMDGKKVQSYNIGTTGAYTLTVHGGSLPAGQYMYSLIIDGKVYDTKQMTLTR